MWVARTMSTGVFVLLSSGVAAAVQIKVADELDAIRDVVRFAPQKSSFRLNKLLEQTPEFNLSRRGEILVEISNAKFYIGDTSEALRLAKKAENLGRQSENKSVIARGLLAQAYALSSTYDELSSQRLVQRAKELADQTDDVALRVTATISLGESVAGTGQQTLGLTLIETALELAEASGSENSKFISLRARASQLASAADYVRALRDIDELISQAKKSAKPAHEARARLTEFTIASKAGNSQRALAALNSAISLLKICGGDEAIVGPLTTLSDLYLQRKNYSKSLGISQRALQLAQKYGNTNIALTAAFNYGIAEIYLGKISTGKRDVEKALKQNDEIFDAGSFLEYASALAYTGDTDAALRNYRRATELSNAVVQESKRKSYENLERAYQYEQKQHEIVELHNKNLLQTIELREQQQKRWRWSALAASSLVLLAILSSFSLRSKRKNMELAIQKNELAAINKKLQWQSDHDTLTGIFNRRFFENYMSAAKEDESPSPKETTESRLTGSLFLIDVDHFKKVNDTFGHSAGDTVLKEVCSRLKSVLRSQDILVRWGGEEFLVFLPAISNSDSERLAGGMLEAVSGEVILAGSKEIQVTISAGYCPVPVFSDGVRMSWEVSVKLADAALYFAKQSGRNKAYGIDNPIDLNPDALVAFQSNFGAAIATNSISSRRIEGSRSISKQFQPQTPRQA